MRFHSKLIAVSIVGFTVFGCALSTQTADFNETKTTTIQPVFPVANNELERQILSNPLLASARKTTEAKSLVLLELDAANALQVSVTGNAGVADGGNDGSKPVATASATASKLIGDGGKLDAQIEVAMIAVDQARVEYALAGNEFIGGILNGLVAYDSARETIAIIDKNLRAYSARKPQIDAAAQQGVLTNSDVLEIRAVKSQIETQRLEARLAMKTSKSQLDSQLTAKSLEIQAQRFARTKALDPKAAPHFNAKAIRLGAASLGAQANRADLAKKADISAVARVTLPASDETGVDVFAGVTLTWTIADGGASAATARRLQLESEAALLARENSLQVADLAGKNLVTGRQIASKRRALLRDRVALSKSRMQELETLLRAGRADVSSIARELLAGAEAEVELAYLSAEIAQQRVATFSAKGATCALIQTCYLFEVNSR